jgi:hypothetical protein
VLQLAVDNITRNLNHFTQYEFLREVLYAAPEFGVPPEMLYEPVSEYLASADEVVCIFNTDGPKRYTTKSILSQEYDMLSALQSQLARRGAQVDNATLRAVMGQNQHLNAQQRASVKHITQNNAANHSVSSLFSSPLRGSMAVGTGNTSTCLITESPKKESTKYQEVSPRRAHSPLCVWLEMCTMVASLKSV